ncbi:Ttc29 [Symbiodinium microadriaticum]|nr:Ttc29 [Symbiodinium microadriaticum]
MLMSSSLKETELKKSMMVTKTPVKPPGKPRFKPMTAKSESSGSGSKTTEAGTEEDFCQQLLVEGYVQSFVDFYHLTQRSDPNSTDGATKKISCTPDEMTFIRNNLVLAEISRRQGNIVGVYTAYNKLAASYKKKRDWKTAIFFQEKCLEVAQLTTDMKAEMTANHTLGEVYQQMNSYELARACHERHEEIARAIDNADDIVTANVELHRVYLVLAQRLEAAGETEDALGMYEMCLGASIKCMDLAAQGEANGKIGNLLLRKGDASAALPYLQQHSQISTDIGDTEARCRACSALAWALDSLGEDQQALAELSLVHSISEQAGDAYLQSQACRALGTLYSKVGQLQEAVNVLQRHFELLKAITSSQGGGDKEKQSGDSTPTVTGEDLELARVFVGISRGNMLMESYMHTISFDMGALLDWKLNRTELQRQQQTTDTQ